MDITDGRIHGLKVIDPRVFADDRGWFCETFSAHRYTAAGIDHTRFVQDNHSRSRQRVIRGLHTRSELRESKLVRCARGTVFDVAVDLRPWSPTFLQWQGFELDDRAHRQLLIPPGCAHGFQALSPIADVCYRVDAYYDPTMQLAIRWNDPDLAIPWPLEDPVLSDKDRAAPTLADVRDHFARWYGTREPDDINPGCVHVNGDAQLGGR
ncbi:MAG: dTDP-4-dehydrorhamnose 3,5-epimerase [Actinobacteria bacterium]|nr:dTDP-4-dehydrorhamnose 3,5-epimerase [Actinomycetota bacterium]